MSIDYRYVVDDSISPHQLINVVIDGEVKGRGYEPRDYTESPPEMFDPPSEIQIFTEQELAERIRDQQASNRTLWDLKTWDSLDQNGQGYCWAYSTTACVMYLRAVMNQPHVRLSAHAIGCMVKNFRDQGGWCGLSAEFHRTKGCPSVEFWAEKSMSRGNDKPETWENAKGHLVTEDWVDLTRQVYDRNLTFQQMCACLVTNNPCALDFNHWGHSVCGIRLENGKQAFNDGNLRDNTSGKVLTVQEFDFRWKTDFTGGFAPRIDNSWTKNWGERGTGILAGSKGIPDGAVCLRVTGASPN